MNDRRTLPARCARIVESSAFNFAIFAVIVANAIVLGLETYESVERDIGGTLETLNAIFLGVFVIELLIRLAAFGTRPQGFFRSGWNVFDFIVVAASFAPGLRENATLLRLLRLARIVRIIRVLPDLRLLVTAMVRSLPGVASLGLLTLVLLYVYGIVGWVIFDDHDPGGFGTVGNAMLTLFVMLSLENLPANIEMGRELSEWTIVYFVSYAMLAAFLIFNLLIGVVINSLEEAQEAEFEREQEERRIREGGTAEDGEGRRGELLQHVHDLRAAVERIEREAHSLVREEERRRDRA
ncbi:MAG: ion transporter [Thermoleophilaceae bacterium]|nr:ion transporter [Thermoleophilaceae bacterium]